MKQGEEGLNLDSNFSKINLANEEALENVNNWLRFLPTKSRSQLKELLQPYKYICRGKLGKTEIAMHGVDVGETVPIK